MNLKTRKNPNRAWGIYQRGKLLSIFMDRSSAKIAHGYITPLYGDRSPAAIFRVCVTKVRQ